MAVILATIHDPDAKPIARIEADAGPDNTRLRVVVDDDSWREPLGELEAGTLRFMINGVVYLEDLLGGDRKLVPLDEVVNQLSNHRLQLRYDTAGVERCHELLRGIARKQPHNVPFSELLDILKQASRAG